MACPFGVIARAPAPNGRVMALKCDLCPDRDVPACVAACPTGALALKQGNELVAAKATARRRGPRRLVSLSAEAIARVLGADSPRTTSAPTPTGRRAADAPGHARRTSQWRQERDEVTMLPSQQYRQPDSGAVLAALHEITPRCGYLPESEIRKVASDLGVPLSQVYQRGHLLRHLQLQAAGPPPVQVCEGTACYVKGSPKLLADWPPSSAWRLTRPPTTWSSP